MEQGEPQIPVRACMWKSEPLLGLQHSAVAYTINAVTALSHLAYVEDPPAETYSLETIALRRVAVGEAIGHSRKTFGTCVNAIGQAKSFRSIHIAAWAAQVRAATLEDLSRDGRLASKAGYSEHVFHSAELMGRRRVWWDWDDRSHVLVLVGLRASGFQLEAVANTLWGTEHWKIDKD